MEATGCATVDDAILVLRSAGKDGGIDVELRASEEESRPVRILKDIGEVRSIDISLAKLDRTLYVAAAVVCHKAGEKQLDYRVIHFRGKAAAINDASEWSVSKSLFTTELSTPQLPMYVTIMDGDSIVATVLQVEREQPCGYSKVTTHVFVAACPGIFEKTELRGFSNEFKCTSSQ